MFALPYVFLLATILVLTGRFPAAHAAEDVDRVVELVVDVCVTPPTPAAWMAVAEDRAASTGWRRDTVRSGLKPYLSSSAEAQNTEAPVWREQAWFLEPNVTDGIDLDVQVAVQPAMPQSGCYVSVPGAVSNDLIAALRAKLGLGEPMPMFGVGEGWVMSGDISRLNENGTLLLVTEQQIADAPAALPQVGGISKSAPVGTRTFAGVVSLVYSHHEP